MTEREIGILLLGMLVGLVLVIICNRFCNLGDVMKQEEMLLINKNEILRHTVNVVGNILVEHSKQHITSDDAIQEIRKVLRKCTSTLNM